MTFMGVLIIIGLAVVVGTIAKRMIAASDKEAKEEKEARMLEKSKAQDKDFKILKNFEINYKPEEGMKVLGADFGGGVIILRIGVNSKTEKIIFLATDGQVIGRVNITK